VLVKAEEYDAKDYNFKKKFTIKRFSYKVWLYDMKNKQVFGFKTFLPDPWPDEVNIKMKRGRIRGDINYIGSNREMFDWLSARLPQDLRDPYEFVPNQYDAFNPADMERASPAFNKSNGELRKVFSGEVTRN
jgi:hypothetical protein